MVIFIRNSIMHAQIFFYNIIILPMSKSNNINILLSIYRVILIPFIIFFLMNPMFIHEKQILSASHLFMFIYVVFQSMLTVCPL